MNKIIIAFAALGLIAMVCNASPEGDHVVQQFNPEGSIEEAYFSDCQGLSDACYRCCATCCQNHEYTHGEEEVDYEDQSLSCHCMRNPIPFQPIIGEVHPTDHVAINMPDNWENAAPIVI